MRVRGCAASQVFRTSMPLRRSEAALDVFDELARGGPGFAVEFCGGNLDADFTSERDDEFHGLHGVENLQIVEGHIGLCTDFFGFGDRGEDVKNLIGSGAQSSGLLPWKKSSRVSL